jgi:hypothetical protein
MIRYGMEIDATELCTFNHNALPVAIDCDVCFGLSQSYYFTRYQKIRIQNVPFTNLVIHCEIDCSRHLIHSNITV